MRLSYTYDLYDEMLNLTLAQIDVELSATIEWDCGIPILDVDGIWATNDTGEEVYLWEGTLAMQKLAAAIKTAAEDDEKLLNDALMKEGMHGRPALRVVYSTNGVRT